MMSDMDILSQMIKKTALVQKDKEFDKLCVILSEPQEQDSSATIRHLPPDALIIKVDAFKSPDTVFNGKNGECKRADFVIISEEKKCILYIEKMKRTKSEWHEIVKQLQGAQCFVKYCQEVGKSFWRNDNFLDNYNSRFISIGRTSISKTKTKISKNAGLHDTPDKALKIDNPHHLLYNRLASVGS